MYEIPVYDKSLASGIMRETIVTQLILNRGLADTGDSLNVARKKIIS